MSKRKPRSGNPARRNTTRTATLTKPPTRPTPRSSGLTTRPPVGVRYPQLLRGPEFTAVNSVLGIVIGISLFLLLTPLINKGVVALGWLTTAPETPFGGFAAEAAALERPVGMLASNLAIVVLIPITIALLPMLHHTRPRWITSVTGHLRWRYLGLCVPAALITLGGMFALSVAIGPATELSPQSNFWTFLLIIVLTSPLQAAAEEVFFRGYLTQAVGSLVSNPWFGIVGSSLIFALFHGGQNLPLFLDRLGFGLLAAILVLKTGGLEASIGAHVINNMLAYTIAGLTTGIAQTRAIAEIAWATAAFDVGSFALFAATAWFISQRLHLKTLSPAAPDPARVRPRPPHHQPEHHPVAADHHRIAPARAVRCSRARRRRPGPRDRRGSS